MGTLSVVVVRSDTGEPIKGVTAAVKGPTSGSGQTDSLGAIIFKDRTPGSYSAKVTMPAEFSSYAITKETPKGSVSPNGNEVLIFKAAPVGNLLVEVYDERGKLVTEEAGLSASGPAGLSHKGKTGSHTFASVAGGAYDVSANLPASLFEAPTVSKRVVVPGGGTGTVRLDVKRRINVVTPKIEMEYRVVVLDRKLSAHQDGSEKKIVTDDVTHVHLLASQSTGTPSYEGNGTFEVSPANVEVYTDPECKHRLSGGKIRNRDLVGGKADLYLKAKTKGKFKAKLKLDPADHPNFEIKDPAEEEMGVVEIEMKLHRYEKADLDIAVNPDVEPYANYWTELKDKQLPDQKALSDEKKVKEGRLLHVQADHNHARAKAVVQKLAADQWPAGTDDYVIALSQQGKHGSVKLFDKDWEGTEKTGDTAKVKVSDLKAKEFEFWIEGEAATKKWRELAVGVDLERPDKDAPHTKDHDPKRNADWAHVTVVQVKEVELSYKPESKKPAAWDEAQERFYINFKPDSDGRKVTITAKLTEEIKGVALHFMLAEDANNMKNANWGLDLPNTWKWKDITADVKHKDKDDRAKLLHLSQATDDKGAAKKELVLSRFGGDVFHPVAYIEQDAHLAKYVHGQAGNDKRKPVRAKKKIVVWRKFWYQEVKVKGLNVAGFGNAADTYRDVKAVMEAADTVEMKRSDADKIRPRVIYPKHMLRYYRDPNTNRYVNSYPGDAGDGLAVGDATESQFFKLVKPSTERPVQVPMLNAHGLWVADGVTSSQDTPWMDVPPAAFPLALVADKKLLDPPLQGGTLFSAGRWEAADWDPAANAGAGAWVNARNGALVAADISLDPSRSDPRAFRISKPATLQLAARTAFRVTGLVLNGATSYLGTSYDDGIVNCYTPNDQVDFINTINHELGHSFSQVTKARPAGIPAHPHQYDNQGSHCNYQNKSCLMYESGPQPVHLDRYCPDCQPYVLVQDMSKLKA
jgi:hypothetical protein